MTKTIDWDKLGFEYQATNSHIIFNWKDGKWDEGTLVKEPYLNIHIAATSLHYGQAAFEGMKAFNCKDGKTRVFRLEENAKRLQETSRRIFLPEVSTEMFEDAVKRVINDNSEFVPPYGTGGSLYIRPLLIGTGAQIGVGPGDQYSFIIFVMPVGAYYKNGLQAIPALIQDEFDRAAPNGVGHVKVAGNYAASLYAQSKAKAKGFPISLYLDAKEHKYVDEFGTSNFIGITDNNEYITPDSSSVLPSITNKSLQQVAKDFGMNVVKRKIAYEELSQFSEVGACGTAVVITPISSIYRNEDEILVKDPEFPVLKKLYQGIQAIQYGEAPDTHNWMTEV